jgi:hypothetical protein
MVQSFSPRRYHAAEIRLLLDLQLLQRMKQAPTPHMSKEILRSSFIAGKVANLERRDHIQQIQELKKQVKQLYEMAKRAIKQFWWVLLKLVNIMLEASPLMFGMGDTGELLSKLQECYNAWVETPGAFGVIQDLVNEEERMRKNARGELSLD